MWEAIEEGTSRMKVPGGWIVRDVKYIGNDIGPGAGCSTAMIFIEDKEHEWKING